MELVKAEVPAKLIQQKYYSKPCDYQSWCYSRINNLYGPLTYICQNLDGNLCPSLNGLTKYEWKNVNDLICQEDNQKPTKIPNVICYYDYKKFNEDDINKWIELYGSNDEQLNNIIIPNFCLNNPNNNICLGPMPGPLPIPTPIPTPTPIPKPTPNKHELIIRLIIILVILLFIALLIHYLFKK